MLRTSRFRGCLLGGAIGDALGAPVEFDSIERIRARFGPAGITEFAPAYGRVGAVTDDTQMTLFTAEGLLRALTRGLVRGICHTESVVSHAYERWMLTQGHPVTPSPTRKTATDGWLYAVPELHHQRAPGRTCLSALATTPRGSRAVNNSKGCGGVMRVAPVGLWLEARGRLAPGEAFELGAEVARLTHGHPSGYLAAGVFATVTQQLAGGATFDGALDLALVELVKAPDHGETLQAVERARQLASTDPEADIETLGQGWVAEEALGMSVFATLVAKDFEHGVRRAVNHSGDSDSTGAITGNLLGVAWGVEALPPRWIDQVEMSEVIAATADDLATCGEWEIDGYDRNERERVILDRYPAH